MSQHPSHLQSPGSRAPAPQANTGKLPWTGRAEGRKDHKTRARARTRAAARQIWQGLMLLHHCRAVTSTPQFTGIRQALNFPNLQELGSDTIQSPALCMSHPFCLHLGTQEHQKPAQLLELRHTSGDQPQTSSKQESRTRSPTEQTQEPVLPLSIPLTASAHRHRGQRGQHHPR